MKNTMMTVVVTLGLVGSLSAQAAVNCDDASIRSKIKTSLSFLVGVAAGGSDKILAVEKIKVLTDGDDTADTIKALYSFEETIGSSDATATVFKMMGYAKFDKATCKQVDGVLLGDALAN